MADHCTTDNGEIILSDNGELDISGLYSAVHLNSIDTEKLKRMLIKGSSYVKTT